MSKQIKKITKPHALLFLAIFIEGYVVLASEILAIRQLVPYVGNSTEIVAIVISAVLLPLSIGYYAGGRAYATRFKQNRGTSVRQLLLKNIRSAAVILTFGLSFLFLDLFFASLDLLGIHHRVLQTSLYALLFLIIPIFLLAQTIPLISNYFSRERLSLLTGRMLFFSTLGSFLGAIISPLLVMAFLGVNSAVVITIGLLVGLALMLNRNNLYYRLSCLGVFLLACFLNWPQLLQTAGIVANNTYSTVLVQDVPSKNQRFFIINNSPASVYSEDQKLRAEYIRYIDQNFIESAKGRSKPLSILVLGAGGFTLGLDDTYHHYTFVDIDGALKEIAEEYFLKQKLSQNKKFLGVDARSFLRGTTERYDLIVLDVYSHRYAMPFHLVTLEFFKEIKKALKNEGYLVCNFVSSPGFQDRFSVNLDHTLRQVFPYFSRQIIQEIHPWETALQYSNILYIYRNQEKEKTSQTYTDNLNRYFFDIQ